MRTHRLLVLALALDLIGAAGTLLLALRPWQTVSVHRPRPLGDVVVDVSGRTVDSAPTALALVALAGVVALLATRGLARRVVGGVVLAAGIGLCWRAVSAASAITAGRARSVLADRRRSLDLTRVTPHVVTHPVWAVLTGACGVLVVAAGVLVVWRGGRWQSMSSRYERPVDESTRAASASGMWTVLDRGDDPTL